MEWETRCWEGVRIRVDAKLTLSSSLPACSDDFQRSARSELVSRKVHTETSQTMGERNWSVLYSVNLPKYASILVSSASRRMAQSMKKKAEPMAKMM